MKHLFKMTVLLLFFTASLFPMQQEEKKSDYDAWMYQKNAMPQLREAQFLLDRFGSNKIKDTETFLDIGCGPGNFLLALAHRHKISLYGMDRSESMIAQAQNNLDTEKEKNSKLQKMDIQFIVGDITATEKLDEKLGLGEYDLITCNAVLHYVEKEKQPQAIKNIVDLLYDNGECIMQAVRKTEKFPILEAVFAAAQQEKIIINRGAISFHPLEVEATKKMFEDAGATVQTCEANTVSVFFNTDETFKNFLAGTLSGVVPLGTLDDAKKKAFFKAVLNYYQKLEPCRGNWWVYNVPVVNVHAIMKVEK